jgi:hypothetical protein
MMFLLPKIEELVFNSGVYLFGRVLAGMPG